METKVIDFTGENIYVGLDVHKNSWSVSILTDEVENRTYKQSPDPQQLYRYLEKNFPGGNYHSAYEAGFCGFGHHRELLALGVDNKVINPADLPLTGKEKHGKTDKIDSRRLAKGLRSGDLRGIHVFDRDHEELRSLSRNRHLFQRDLRRYKGRIKSFLFYFGIPVPPEHDNPNWSLGFIRWLKQIKMETTSGQYTLTALIDGMEYHRSQMKEINNQVRQVMRTTHKELYNLLRTVPGIGPLTAMCLISELGDINRFKNIRHLSSFAGLLPMMHSSGEKEWTGGISHRCNSYLRTMLIEASWQAIRRDPALLLYYKKHAGRTDSRKAIVKVARKLLTRIRFVMKQRQPYEIGKV